LAQAEDAVLAAKQTALAAAAKLAGAEAVAAAEKAARNSQAAALAAWEQQGFGGAEAVRAASMAEAEAAAIERELAQAAAEQQALESQLAQPQLALANAGLDQARDGLVAARAEADEAGEESSALRALAAVAQQRGVDCQAKTAAVLAACRELEGSRREHQPLIYVSELANGKSSQSDVDLPTFVLIRRFEEVVAAANDRLQPMSSGRFALERSDDKEGSHRSKGLSLRVMDFLTGEARDPRTLSGGESFYVSLALALGLADIVTAEAGGVDLGTLFIDEGFGSLDDEVRDRVLQVLGGLRAGGRVVGIVSHVDALKQSIAERVTVFRLPDGSSSLSVRA
jgi:exonuclease SbcC